MTKSERHAPKVIHLRVEGVRLYNDGEPLDIDLRTRTSAFVGANGIGKSTLLALANFALTGLVPDARVSFSSVDEFAQRTSPFSDGYFTGRVGEADRDLANVSVRFKLGDHEMEVTRGLFEGRLVRSFSTSGRRFPVENSSSSRSQSDITAEYQAAVVKESGLANFEQFCFWQLFLMTFDERRHLLFWDSKTLQSVLMISLGRDPKDAIEAEALARNMERQDSLARNARWRATQATNRRRKVSKNLGNSTDLTDQEFLTLEEEQRRLEAALDYAQDAVAASEVALRDCSRTLAELAIRESELEKLYLDEFTARPVGRDPRQHTAIAGILRGGSCEFCGHHATALSAPVLEALAADHCPLCASTLSDHIVDPGLSSRLVQTDTELGTTRRQLESSRATYHRLRDEATNSAALLEAASAELESFTQAGQLSLTADERRQYKVQLSQLDQEISSAMKDTEEYRKVRDSHRDELAPIIAGLAEGYAAIESVFVPNFRRLAEQFIGRAVDVEFEKNGINIGLRFALDGQSRRSPSELSESQQYFLDIALRMSLAQTFLSRGCTMLIDTPEGSLDIAYETRAGLLFKQFVDEGYSLIVMSNLNASGLMTELATLSNDVDMEIFKMIEWSRLSDVQLQSVDLFDREYDRLAALLMESSG